MNSLIHCVFLKETGMTYLHLTLNKKNGRQLLRFIVDSQVAGKVYYLQDDLSFGPLPPDVDNFYPRNQWLEDFFGEYSPESQDIHFYANNAILNEINDLLKHASIELIIWADTSPNDQTWLRFLSKFFSDWEQIEVIGVQNGIGQFLRMASISDIMESHSYQTSEIDKWNQDYNSLLKARSLLRIVSEEELKSVPLNHFDKQLKDNPDSNISSRISSRFVAGRIRYFQIQE